MLTNQNWIEVPPLGLPDQYDIWGNKEIKRFHLKHNHVSLIVTQIENRSGETFWEMFFCFRRYENYHQDHRVEFNKRIDGNLTEEEIKVKSIAVSMVYLHERIGYWMNQTNELCKLENELKNCI